MKARRSSSENFHVRQNSSSSSGVHSSRRFYRRTHRSLYILLRQSIRHIRENRGCVGLLCPMISNHGLLVSHCLGLLCPMGSQPLFRQNLDYGDFLGLRVTFTKPSRFNSPKARDFCRGETTFVREGHSRQRDRFAARFFSKIGNNRCRATR